MISPLAFGLCYTIASGAVLRVDSLAAPVGFVPVPIDQNEPRVHRRAFREVHVA